MKTSLLFAVIMSVTFSAQTKKNPSKFNDSVKIKLQEPPLLYDLNPSVADADPRLKMYKMPNVKPGDTSLYSRLNILDRKILTYQMPNNFDRKKPDVKKEK